MPAREPGPRRVSEASPAYTLDLPAVVSPGPGRPTRFTPEVLAKLLQAVEDGNKHHTACNLAGISFSLFREWVVAGERGEPGFVEFVDQLHKAEGLAEANLLKTIKAAGDTDWKAAGWIMARRFGWIDESRLNIEHTGTVENKIEITVVSLTDLSGISRLLNSYEQPQLVEGVVVDTSEKTDDS